MDPNRGIMLAHRMNGEPLRADHGFPLRAVIPGQIGGRSVKWIKKLVVTAEPSDNWYHIYDNRVLPYVHVPVHLSPQPLQIVLTMCVQNHGGSRRGRENQGLVDG